MKNQRQIKIGGLYGRVSDADSAEHGSSLESQKHLGLEQARQLTESTGISHEIRHILIEESGVSGGTTNRPKYQQLLNLIRSGRIEFVVAKEVSRLSRSTRDFIEFMDLCKANGVAVHIRGLSIDPKNAISNFMFQLLATIAELERQIIRERTRSSIRSAAINNGKINGGTLVLGFDRDPTRTGFWLPNKTELNQVVFLMNTFNQTLSYKATLEVATKSNIKNKNGSPLNQNSLRRLLTQQKYIGRMKVPDDTKEIWVDLPHGCVIPKDLFELTQKNTEVIENQYSRKNRRSKKSYLLTGLLYFEDGSSFTGLFGKSRNGDLHYYYGNKPHKLNIRALELEKSVLGVLRMYENDEKMMTHVNEIRRSTFSKSDFVNNQIQAIDRDLAKVNDDEANLVQKLSSAGGTSERITKWLEDQLKAIESNRSSLQSSRRELEMERDKLATFSIEAKQLKQSLRVVFDRFEKSDPDVQRGILRQLVEKITVFKDNKIEVRWRVPCESGGRRFDFEKEWGD